jgi:hypothetical protein
MIATGVIANPSDNYKFMIILSAKSYYSGEVKVLIASILVGQQMVELGCKSCELCRTILSN